MAIELQRRRPPTEQVPSKGAVRLIAAFEGLSLKSYPDPATGGDPWTAGYGHTGPDVKPGMTITLKQADDWLVEDLEKAAGIVRSNILVPLTPGEFDALCSLAFNLGYLPRSLKACLNGGVTDKGDKMEPGSYGSALKQFPRNCRAAGMPMRGLLRRRLAEACVFSDLPWEAACSMNLIRLKCDAKGNIDPDETTSLEDTLERARQDVPMGRPPIDVTKPWPTPSAPRVEVAPAPLQDSAIPSLQATIDGIPTQLPLPGEVLEDELVLDRPAAPLATEANGTASAPEATQPVPAQARVPQTDSNPAASPAGSPAPSLDPKPPNAPKAAPVSPLPPLPVPKPPPVIAPKSIDIRSIPYGEVDPANGAKNMTDSTRFVGLLIVAGGSLVQVLAAREVVSSTAGAIFFDLSRDPVIVALIAGGVIWAVGSVTKWWGRKVITKGMVEAKEVLK